MLRHGWDNTIKDTIKDTIEDTIKDAIKDTIKDTIAPRSLTGQMGCVGASDASVLGSMGLPLLSTEYNQGETARYFCIQSPFGLKKSKSGVG